MSIFTFIILLACTGIPAFFLTITYPLNHQWALFWSNYIATRCARLVFAILRLLRGFRFLGERWSKERLPEQFLVVSNHQSLLDIVVYLCYFSDRKVRFVAKDNLNSVPMVGKMLRSQGHCMIPRRGKPVDAMRALSRFGGQVAADRSVVPVIFPEGTRSKDGRLGTFYSAGFRRLEQTVNLPVAVCALDGGWKLSKLTQIMSGLKRGAYRVKVLKVFDAPATKEQEKTILAEASRLIQQQLDEWRALPADSLEV